MRSACRASTNGKLSSHLLAPESLDKIFVRRHQLVKTLTTISLRLDELDGLWRMDSELLSLPMNAGQLPP